MPSDVSRPRPGGSGAERSRAKAPPRFCRIVSHDIIGALLGTIAESGLARASRILADPIN